MRKLNFFSDSLRARYGKPLQRIPIDLALGCPNRPEAYGPGCIFCAENGSRARHLARNLNLQAQVQAGIEYNHKRYNATAPYIAYFQSFTSTFAPVDTLRRLYREVLEQAEFNVVMVGTRPDALPPEVIDFLQELTQEYEVWVELGVQSSSDRTLELIRRGHNFAAVREAATALHRAGIRCAAHVILGLPGETAADFRQTARELAALPFQAVKLHQLQILKGTELAAWFRQPNPPAIIQPLNEYEYAAVAADFLHALPEDWLIMRLMADADPAELIAPRWWMSKGQFLEFFRERFEAGTPDFFPGVITADGSRTLYHPDFRQPFHTLAGAAGEAEHKFLRPGNLTERLCEQKTVKLLDIGFGLGGNAAAAVATAENVQAGRLLITSLEYDRRTLPAARTICEPDSTQAKLLDSLIKTDRYEGDFASVKLLIGDARITLPEVNEQFDLVWLDGFSPDCNPELWSFDFLREVKARLKHDGLLLSYSSSHAFRGALLKLGMAIGESAPFGRKRGGTVAALKADRLEIPLPEKEFDIIRRSTAGVPYFDRGLRHSRAEILDYRQRLAEKLRRRGIPKWFKTKD